MLFGYKAKDNKGKRVSGELEAKDQNTALTALKEKDLFVTHIAEKKGSGNPLSSFFRKKVPLKDKIIFTKQLAIMIRSGLSILEALQSLQEESANKALEIITLDLISQVQGGTALSEAMANHKENFSDIYISMVKSGEKSGNVDDVLDRLAKQLEQDYDLIRKIKGALSYPIFVLITMVVVVCLVIVIVIPQLKVIFDDAGVDLPALTRGMIAVSVFLKNDGIYVALAMVALVFMLSRWRQTKTGRYFFDKAIITIPLVNLLVTKAYMARFTRTFAVLTSSGLPLLEAIQSSGQVIGNILYQEEIIKMSAKIENGELLSSVFKKSKMFPKMIGQLASVGEKSGNIDEVFGSMADFFDREVDGMTSNLSSLLEPILMVVIGVGVGLVVVSVLQPIYSLVNVI